MRDFTKIVIMAAALIMSTSVQAQKYSYGNKKGKNKNGYHHDNQGYKYGQHNDEAYRLSRYHHRLPDRVVWTAQNYRGYHWVGTTLVNRGHRDLFVVTLRRGNLFVELTMNRHGRILSRKEFRKGRRDRWYSQNGYHRRSVYHGPHGKGKVYEYWGGPSISYNRNYGYYPVY